MNKTREMIPVNIALFALFVAAMAVALTVNRVQTIDRSVPHFIYEEVRIQKRAPGQIRAKVQSRTEALSKAVSVKRPPVVKTVPPLFPPKVVSSVVPAYPRVAVENGIEGLVIVQVLVSEGGESQSVLVKRSSGNEHLDKSALFAISQWEFSPALQGQAPVSSWFEIPVAFELKQPWLWKVLENFWSISGWPRSSSADFSCFWPRFPGSAGFPGTSSSAARG